MVSSHPWGHGGAFPVGWGPEFPGLGVTRASLSTAPQGAGSLPAQKPPPRLPLHLCSFLLCSRGGPLGAEVTADPRWGAGVPVGSVPRTLQSRDPCVQPAPSSHTQPSPPWPTLPTAGGWSLGRLCGLSFCSVAPDRLQRGESCRLWVRGRH